MKQKTNRLHFSTRTLAMVLSIVMLIGSIATGSMLNTFAAYLKDAAANSDAVSQAASEGSDIALNAIPSQDAAEAAEDDSSDAPLEFEENNIVKGLKRDLTVTGANTDLAETGAGAFYIYYNIGSSSGSFTQATMTLSGTNNPSYTFTGLTSGQTVYFKISEGTSGSQNWYGNTSWNAVSSEKNFSSLPSLS